MHCEYCDFREIEMEGLIPGKYFIYCTKGHYDERSGPTIRIKGKGDPYKNCIDFRDGKGRTPYLGDKIGPLYRIEHHCLTTTEMGAALNTLMSTSKGEELIRKAFSKLAELPKQKKKKPKHKYLSIGTKVVCRARIYRQRTAGGTIILERGTGGSPFNAIITGLSDRKEGCREYIGHEEGWAFVQSKTVRVYLVREGMMNTEVWVLPEDVSTHLMLPDPWDCPLRKSHWTKEQKQYQSEWTKDRSLYPRDEKGRFIKCK